MWKTRSGLTHITQSMKSRQNKFVSSRQFRPKSVVVPSSNHNLTKQNGQCNSLCITLYYLAHLSLSYFHKTHNFQVGFPAAVCCFHGVSWICRVGRYPKGDLVLAPAMQKSQLKDPCQMIIQLLLKMKQSPLPPEGDHSSVKQKGLPDV